MDRALAHRHRRFLDRFRHGRVGVDRAGQVFGAATVFHVSDDLTDQLAGILAEDLRAEDFVGLGVGDDLDVAVAGVVGQRAGVGGKVELAHVDRQPLGFGGVFTQPHGGELGVGVNNRRHQIPVNMAVFSCDPLGNRDAVFLGLVREHRAVDDVTNRPYASSGGLEVGVHLDALLVGQRDAGGGQVEVVGKRAAAHGDEHLVGGEL